MSITVASDTACIRTRVSRSASLSGFIADHVPQRLVIVFDIVHDFRRISRIAAWRAGYSQSRCLLPPRRLYRSAQSPQGYRPCRDGSPVGDAPDRRSGWFSSFGRTPAPLPTPWFWRNASPESNGPPPRHGVAQTIGERADPGALRLICEAISKRSLWLGIPAFAKEVDIRVQRFNKIPQAERICAFGW